MDFQLPRLELVSPFRDPRLFVKIGALLKWEGPLDLLRIILAIFIPPVAAFLTVGITLHFWINILLCLFFVVPGMIHALWLVVKKS